MVMSRSSRSRGLHRLCSLQRILAGFVEIIFSYSFFFYIQRNCYFLCVISLSLCVLVWNDELVVDRKSISKCARDR